MPAAAEIISLADRRAIREDAKKGPQPYPTGGHDICLIGVLVDILRMGLYRSASDRRFMISLVDDPRWQDPDARLYAADRDRAHRIIGRAVATRLYGSP